jgi:hypothetical protein
VRAALPRGFVDRNAADIAEAEERHREEFPGDAGCIDRRESVRSQRNGTGKRRRSEAVWLMTCRSCSVSAAISARSRMRTPRSRSCGRRNAGMGKQHAWGIRRAIRLLLWVGRRGDIEEGAGRRDVLGAVGVGEEPLVAALVTEPSLRSTRGTTSARAARTS